MLAPQDDQREAIDDGATAEARADCRAPNACANTSGVRAFITCAKAQLLLPFRPRSTARCVANVKLPIVFASHAICILAGLALCFLGSTFVMYALDTMYSSRPWLTEQFGSYPGFIRSGLREAWQALFYPESWAVITTIVLVLEGALACLASLLLPVAAADEPLLASVRRSLRTAWLGAPFVYWLVFGLFTAGSIQNAMQCTILARTPRSEWPFFLRDEDFVGLAAVLIGIWILWALFRAASPRPVAAERIPTTQCESCGYQLSHTPIESRCPECGEPAADSIGEGLRRTNAWELAPGFSPAAYLRTAIDVLGGTSRFYRTMCAWGSANRARRYLIVSAVLTGLLADVSFLLYDLAVHPLRRIALDTIFSRGNLEILTFLPFISFGGLLGFVLLTAAWLGIQLSRAQRRNMLAPTAKVCFYASALYVVWLPANALLWAGLEFVTRTAHVNLLPEQFRYGLSREDQVGFAMLLVNAFLPILIWRYHRIGLKAVEHANR